MANRPVAQVLSEVFEYLKDHPGLPVAEISEAINRNRSAVGNHLRRRSDLFLVEADVNANSQPINRFSVIPGAVLPKSTPRREGNFGIPLGTKHRSGWSADWSVQPDEVEVVRLRATKITEAIKGFKSRKAKLLRNGELPTLSMEAYIEFLREKEVEW